MRSSVRKATEELARNDGVALIATLILGMIAISFTLTMIYLSREGSRLSGIEGRYQKALQAAKGGVEVAIDYVRNCSPANTLPAFYASHTGTLNCACSMGTPGNKTYYPCDGSSASFVSLIGNYQVYVSIKVETLESSCENAPTDPTKKSVVSFCRIISNSTNTDTGRKERASVDVLYKLSVDNCGS